MTWSERFKKFWTAFKAAEEKGYDVIGMTMTIALKGEKALVVSLPMQPEFELVPYKGAIFHVKGLSGYSIEFKSDAAGVVTEALVEQPSGVVTATKKAAS